MADAGAPYSPSVASLPGTVNGIGDGNVPPLPPIPGYVSASYPSTPTNNQTQGGYQIASSASANSAKGTVSLGVQPSGSQNSTFFASAETTANGDGSVTVDASAGMDALDFGQLFDLGNVSSTMSMTQQSNQQPTVTSQTNLGTITLLGQASGLNAAGVSALGEGTPIDINSAVLGALNSLLSGAGIKFTYLPETFTYTDGQQQHRLEPRDGQDAAVDRLGRPAGDGDPEPAVAGPDHRVAHPRTGVRLDDGHPRHRADHGEQRDDRQHRQHRERRHDDHGLDLGPSREHRYGERRLGPPLLPPATPGSSPPSSATTASRTLQTAPAFAVEEGPPAQSLYLVLVLGALAMLLGAQAVRYLAVRLALSGRTQ